MVKIETVKKFCTITPRTQEMVDEIMARKGHMTFSEFVRAATERYYEDLIRSEMYQGKRTDKGNPRVGAMKSKAAEEQEQQDICDALGGTVQTNPDGGKVCVYYTYFERKRYEQKVSFGMLDRELVKTQYQPSKAKVEKLKEEGKTDW